MMITLPIKPLSVNEAYRGRRFATSKLKDYKEDLWKILPHMEIPDGKLEVKYVFGLSSKGGDGDNLIKAFQDCLSEGYGFNDNRIYKWTIEKVDVRKSQEYIGFEISSLNEV